MPVAGQLRWIAAFGFGLLLASSFHAQAKPAADSDADCLACHNDKDLKSESGRSVYDTAPVHSGCASYVEKIEYWAFVWGTCVMTATGFLLWFNSFALRHFPKWVSDAATALHYYEAILATLSILIWHMYTVVFDPAIYPMDRSCITGKAPSPHSQVAPPARVLAADRAAEEPAVKASVDQSDPPGQIIL